MDYHFTSFEQQQILQSVKIDSSGEPIKTEEGETILDAISTLIYVIAQYFIGDPTHLKDRSSEVLTNLKCKSLSDFRWYKDTFLTRVMFRSDNNQPFWKEKFLVGLPRLLGDKVRAKLEENYNGSIP